MAASTDELPDFVRRRLRCPTCAAPLILAPACRCTNDRSPHTFPIVEGVPILIDESRSVFAHADFVDHKKTYYAPDAPNIVRRRLASLLYENTTDLRTDSLLSRFAALAAQHDPRPTVLVIGAGIDDSGIEPLRSAGAVIVATDVFLGPGVVIASDAHDLPFADGTFDGIVIQAVLEHVLDPHRCVDEIHRVLRDGGVVFSDIPFMQQVHGGRFDFTRFTHLGHRRLFRRFEEIESGASAGPGLALCWAYQYFLLSFATTKLMTRLLRILGKLTSFWWKYFDRFLLDRPGALDAASTTYFLGRRIDEAMTDRALIASYRGLNQRF